MRPILFFTKRRKLARVISRLPSLSAYWPLGETNGNAINYSPGSPGQFAGTVSNATQGQPGAIGRAYSFDGVGDRVILSGFIPTAVFSFSIAFKRNGTPDANDRIVDQASGGPTKGWNLLLGTNGSVSFQTWSDSGISLNLSYGIVPDGEWVVLGGSIGASSSTIYLNGIEVNSGGVNNFGAGVVADLQLGARSGGTSNAMSGYLQHFAIANNVEWTPAQHENIVFF